MIDSLTVIGDVCLAGPSVRTLTASDRPDWRPLKRIASGTFLIANLECPLSDRGTPIPWKYATLRAHPATADSLEGLDLAVLANNHISDFGNEAVEDTLQLLETRDVAGVGYGRDVADAWQPHETQINGIPVLIFAASCPTTNGENLATHVLPGVAPLSGHCLQQQLEAVSMRPAIKIVYLHWGLENQHRVVPEQVALARAAIDWGADAVVGCHGHVIQPYEQYRDRWIFYGLGNFVFGDVDVRITDEKGGVREAVVRPEAPNREALAARFQVCRNDSRPSLSLQEVAAYSSADGLAPRPVDIGDLTCDLQEMNREIPPAQSVGAYAVRERPEPVYATHFWDGVLIYHYYSEKIPAAGTTQSTQSGLRRQLWNRAKGLLKGQ